MNEPEITVKKLSGFAMFTRQELDDGRVLGDALAAVLTEASKPGHVPPKPWEGPPITPVPEAYGQLFAASGPLVRKLLDLHSPKPYMVYPDGTVPSWKCEGCGGSGYDWEYPDWPCETTAVIAHHLEVTK